MARTSAKEIKAPDRGISAAIEGIQEKTAFLPDYDFKKVRQAGGIRQECGERAIRDQSRDVCCRTGWSHDHAGFGYRSGPGVENA